MDSMVRWCLRHRGMGMDDEGKGSRAFVVGIAWCVINDT